MLLTYGENMALLRFLLMKISSLGLVINKTAWQDIDDVLLSNIMRRWIPQGKAGLSACATELIKAGFRGNAKL